MLNKWELVFFTVLFRQKKHMKHNCIFFVDAMGYLQPSVKFRPEMAMFNQLYEGNANTIAKEVY